MPNQLTSLVKIREIARKTRRWAKVLQSRYSDLGDKDLGGMCAIASFELFKRLKRLRFKVCLYANDEHCYLEWEPGSVIIDITCTQFGNYPPVTMFRRHRGLESWWGRQKKLTALSKAKRWFDWWPPEQCPFRFKKYRKSMMTDVLYKLKSS